MKPVGSHTTRTQRAKRYHVQSGRFVSRMHDAVFRILEASSTDTLYASIGDEVKKLVKAKYVSIYTVADGQLQKIYTSDPRLKAICPRRHGFTYQAYKEAVPHTLDNRNVLTIHPEVIEMGILSTLFIPLTSGIKPYGVISVDFDRRLTFSDDILKTLKIFGTLVTAKMKNVRLREELQETVRNYELFMSLAAHELNNPLSVVSAYVSLLQRRVREKKEIKPSIIDQLQVETKHMATLIHEYLHVQRAEVNPELLRYKKRSCNIQEIIRDTIAQFALSRPERPIIYQNCSRRRDMVFVDYHKIVQVLTNIINNALKFSPTASSVCVRLESRGGEVIIKIFDRGTGIAKKDLVHIFKRFYKGKNQREGMGLGLYLSKKIIEAHGGSIWVESKLKKGTTVEVRVGRIP